MHLIAGLEPPAGSPAEGGVCVTPNYALRILGHPLAILCVSNTGLLKIGSTGPGDANATLPADCTRVEDHRGTCQTQVNYSGSWDTPTAGLLEQNTSWAAAPSIVVPIAVELHEADVGLDAAWVP